MMTLLLMMMTKNKNPRRQELRAGGRPSRRSSAHGTRSEACSQPRGWSSGPSGARGLMRASGSRKDEQ
eukprot:1124668-Pyramimonas_sp.AAC.1